MASWFRQGKWRRAARHHEAEAERARTQLADVRSQVAREGQQRFPALAPGGIREPSLTGAFLCAGLPTA